MTIKHPRKQKKLRKAKMAKKNLKSFLSGTFGFDPKEYLDKFFLFDLNLQ